MEIEKEKLSNCCYAPRIGELSDDSFGRCSDCKEMAVFKEDKENLDD